MKTTDIQFTVNINDRIKKDIKKLCNDIFITKAKLSDYNFTSSESDLILIKFIIENQKEKIKTLEYWYDMLERKLYLKINGTIFSKGQKYFL